MPHDFQPPSRLPPLSSRPPRRDPHVKRPPPPSSQLRNLRTRTFHFQKAHDNPEGSTKSISNLSNAIPSRLEPSSQDADLEDVETNGDFLLSLLWPGWPPHLPNPGQLEAIVEVFFDKVPLASEMLNKGRFLTRLALPPRHHLFPHPALLHAICACTARFLPSLVLLPPNRLPSLSPPPQRDDLEASPRPRWDGVGPIPIDTTPGLDGDFGEIHHFWGSFYVEKARQAPPRDVAHRSTSSGSPFQLLPPTQQMDHRLAPSCYIWPTHRSSWSQRSKWTFQRRQSETCSSRAGLAITRRVDRRVEQTSSGGGDGLEPAFDTRRIHFPFEPTYLGKISGTKPTLTAGSSSSSSFGTDHQRSLASTSALMPPSPFNNDPGFYSPSSSFGISSRSPSDPSSFAFDSIPSNTFNPPPPNISQNERLVLLPVFFLRSS